MIWNIVVFLYFRLLLEHGRESRQGEILLPRNGIVVAGGVLHCVLAAAAAAAEALVRLVVGVFGDGAGARGAAGLVGEEAEVAGEGGGGVT